jgi:hypothetical protein
VAVVLAGAALALGGCSDSHDAFREAYVDRAACGDKFAEQPPSLTDNHIDAAIEEVCVNGRLAPNDGSYGGVSALGSAIADGVKAAGCP